MLTAFGVRFRSSLPGDDVGSVDAHGAADVDIREGLVPEHLEDASARGVWYDARQGEVVLRVEQVARYWIRDGRTITVMPEPGADPHALRLYLWGPAVCVLLHQRRDALILHASGVEIDGGAVLFAGPSGVGKSSLTAAVARVAAVRVLTDDICPLRDVGGVAHASPGHPRLKLWPDTLTAIGDDPALHPRVRDGLEKRWVPVDLATRSLPVRRIYRLATTNTGKLRTEAIAPLGRVSSLRQLTHRSYLLAPLGTRTEHFHLVSAVARRTDMRLLVRPYDACGPEALARHVLDDIEATC
jgi:hypothetical protein